MNSLLPPSFWRVSSAALLLLLRPPSSEANFDVDVLEDPIGVETGRRVVMTVQADVDDDLEDCRCSSTY